MKYYTLILGFLTETMLKLEVRALLLVFCLASVILASHTQKEKKRGWKGCPNRKEFLPCTCDRTWTDELTISCSKAKNQEEIRIAFTANFPNNKEFVAFSIEENEEFKVLESNIFNGVAFKEVNIQYTGIESMDIKVFEDSSEILNSISLQYNHITHISLETEKSFPALSFIHLNGNNLTEFPFESLKDFPNLYSFDIDYNPLGIIPVDSFQETSLSIISLAGTAVNEFTVGTFSNQSKLMGLWAGSNNLNHIPSGLFVTGSSHFESLYLNDNGIVSVEPNAFDLNRHLTIYMSGNSLTTIEESVWREPFEAHVKLSLLDNNPLECGCDVAWIVNDPALKKQVATLTKCADGRDFQHLHPEDFVDC